VKRPGRYERHTSVRDVKWVLDLYDRITGS
jgi:hypothetical protein